MTIPELYDASPDFRALVSQWVQDERCPIGLVDWLLENDQPDAAECARWCADRPDQNNFDHNDKIKTGMTPCGFDRNGWCWSRDLSDNRGFRAHHIPGRYLPVILDIDNRETRYSPEMNNPESAIVWLLANWIVASPAPAGAHP